MVLSAIEKTGLQGIRIQDKFLGLNAILIEPLEQILQRFDET